MAWLKDSNTHVNNSSAVASPITRAVMCPSPPEGTTHYYFALDEKIWVKKKGDSYTYINYGNTCSLHECYVKRLIKLNI